MTRDQYIAGLRKLADLYEQHEAFPVPSSGEFTIYAFGCDTDEETRTMMAEIARALGQTEKSYDDNYFRLRSEISPGCKVEVTTRRGSVCRKVKVMKEVEEWQCDEFLLASAPVPQMADAEEDERGFDGGLA